MTFGNTSIAKSKIEERSVDFSISLDNIEIKNSEKMILKKGRFVLYMGKKSKKQGEYFILTGETPECLDFQKKYKKLFKSDPQIIMEIKSWGVLKKLADEGQGIALIPDYILSPSELKYTLDSINLLEYCIVAIWPSGRSLNRKCMEFINSIR